jgi:hypothetical protein
MMRTDAAVITAYLAMEGLRYFVASRNQAGATAAPRAG